MAVITKTDDIVVLAHQAITHPGSVAGSNIAVADDLAATIVIYHANIETTANAIGVRYYIQTSPSSGTDNDDWGTIAQFQTTETPANLANLAGSEAIGQTVLDVVAGEESGFSANQQLYIRDTGTLADSEWALCDGTATDDIKVVDGITRAKDSADDILNEAEIFIAQLDLTAAKRLRIVVVHRAATGSDIHTKAIMVRGDSIG